MEKMGYARGLIRYSTTRAMQKGLTRREMLLRAFRPRILIYAAILLAVAGAAGATLWMRVPVKMDVIRDRAAIAREVEGGLIENVYRLQIMNTSERARALELSVKGLRGIHIPGETTIGMPAATSRVVLVKVRVEPGIAPGTHPIEFELRALGEEHLEVEEKSVFIVR
jgi:polyferredoxin